jgi:hypothetical protein
MRGALNMPESHPVVEYLQSWLHTGRLSAAERIVLELGRVYRPTLRPKYFRLRAPKQCFFNAGEYAGRGPQFGNYVEGYAASATQPPFHHAWLSLDGETAIDVTLRDPMSYQYFGIEIPTTLLEIWMVWRRHFGILDPFDESLIKELRASRT